MGQASPGEIRANWERARRNEPLHGIEPLSWHGNMSENYLPVVVGAAVVGDHVLRLLFSDGMVGDVDFSAERWTGVLAPLNDSAYFAEVTVDPEAGSRLRQLGTVSPVRTASACSAHGSRCALCAADDQARMISYWPWVRTAWTKSP